MNESYILFILYQFNVKELFILIHNNKSSLLSVASCNWWQKFPRVEAPLDMVPWGGGSLPLSSFQKKQHSTIIFDQGHTKIGNIGQNVMLKITRFLYVLSITTRKIVDSNHPMFFKHHWIMNNYYII